MDFWDSTARRGTCQFSSPWRSFPPTCRRGGVRDHRVEELASRIPSRSSSTFWSRERLWQSFYTIDYATCTTYSPSVGSRRYQPEPAFKLPEFEALANARAIFWILTTLKQDTRTVTICCGLLVTLVFFGLFYSILIHFGTRTCHKATTLEHLKPIVASITTLIGNCDSMEATYCVGSDIDVCRMFDQYLYKVRLS